MSTVKDWLDALAPDQGDDECILFPFSLGSHGYGQFQSVGYGRKPVLAHRYVCQKFRGDPPVGAVDAAHSCGNKKCVNRNHIRWANKSENETDKIVHGTDNRGERHGLAKLTAPEAMAIKNATGMNKDIAKQFDISPATVSDIKRGRRWTHLS